MKDLFFQPRGLFYRANDYQSDRQTIVFVHGLSGSSSAWIPYEREFMEEFNIVTLDLRGHGKSEKPEKYEDYKIENFADDLCDLVDYLRLDKFILVGHSLGSLVVLAFLREHQERVSKTIFFAANFAGGNMLSARVAAPFLWVGTSILKRLPSSKLPGNHVDYSLYPNGGDWDIQRIVADVRNTTLRVYLYATRQAYYFDAENFLKDIHIPVLIVHGQNDTIFPFKYGALMSDKIQGSKFVLLKDANHVLVLNKIKDIIKEIKNFVL